jgi:hypothetical protein
VSADHTEPEFNSFFEEMPWLALPFRERDRQRGLVKRFGVAGLPKLVILSSDGALISKDGRDLIDSDPTGVQFPWRPADCTTERKRSIEADMMFHQTQGWSLVAMGFCVPALFCWWIPVVFFVSVQNFADTCETDLQTWMQVFSVMVVTLPPIAQLLMVLCAKCDSHGCYSCGAKLNWLVGLVICGYFMYGLYLYENSTFVLCYDGTGLNPMVIMRVLWVFFIVVICLLCLVVSFVCCSNGSDQMIVDRGLQMRSAYGESTIGSRPSR